MTVTSEDLAAAIAEANASAPKPIKQRAYESDASVSFFGVMNIIVDLVPAKLSDKVSFKIVCPECDEPHSMSQRYICTADPAHGDGNDEDLPGFASSTAGRGKVINGALVKVEADEIADIKGAQLPRKELAVSVYPAADVERLTRPSGTAYRLRPKGALPIYAMLVDLVSDQSKAFIGEMNVRDQDKLFRVEAWNGQLVVTELARPSETAPADEINATYEPKLLSMAAQLAEVQSEPFDPTKFTNTVKQRAAEFEARKQAEGAAPAQKPVRGRKPKDADAQVDLLAALEASLKKAQAS